MVWEVEGEAVTVEEGSQILRRRLGVHGVMTRNAPTARNAGYSGRRRRWDLLRRRLASCAFALARAVFAASDPRLLPALATEDAARAFA